MHKLLISYYITPCTESIQNSKNTLVGKHQDKFASLDPLRTDASFLNQVASSYTFVRYTEKGLKPCLISAVPKLPTCQKLSSIYPLLGVLCIQYSHVPTARILVHLTCMQRFYFFVINIAPTLSTPQQQHR